MSTQKVRYQKVNTYSTAAITSTALTQITLTQVANAEMFCKLLAEAKLTVQDRYLESLGSSHEGAGWSCRELTGKKSAFTQEKICSKPFVFEKALT